MFCAFGIGCILLNSIAFLVIDADFIMLIGVVWMVLSIGAFALFLIESPRWLVDKGRFSECLTSLANIYKFNNGGYRDKDKL